ncbi:MAG: hypothetical protein HXS41_06620 [Theionarchaea archaeon]|nr:hypothetical protein [Theionarchaea archaeon]MBU7020714.1 hypothetical protein [Theionarchaea archaeon]MBU7041683.1 hypothetical protein [Theionarchaea archaeon]
MYELLVILVGSVLAYSVYRIIEHRRKKEEQRKKHNEVQRKWREKQKRKHLFWQMVAIVSTIALIIIVIAVCFDLL